jgi:SAM-dependent methyltransferase
LEEQFDTGLMINVLEHVPDEQQALQLLRSTLQPGGRAIILVPQHPGIYGTLDRALDHRERYTSAQLEESLRRAGFRVERVLDFNRFSVPGWWLNGKVLKRNTFSRVQIKTVNTLIPLLKRIDHMWPWSGLSLIGVGVRD